MRSEVGKEAGRSGVAKEPGTVVRTRRLGLQRVLTRWLACCKAAPLSSFNGLAVVGQWLGPPMPPAPSAPSAGSSSSVSA